MDKCKGEKVTASPTFTFYITLCLHFKIIIEDSTSESQGDSIFSSSLNPMADIVSVKCSHRYINENIHYYEF